MFRKKKSSIPSLLITFGIGAVAGAALALLYAPMSGRKMQRRVADVTEKVLEGVEDKVENIQATVRRFASA